MTDHIEVMRITSKPMEVSFRGKDGQTLGTLKEENGVLSFDGDPDTSGAIFMQYIGREHGQAINRAAEALRPFANLTALNSLEDEARATACQEASQVLNEITRKDHPKPREDLTRPLRITINEINVAIDECFPMEGDDVPAKIRKIREQYDAAAVRVAEAEKKCRIAESSVADSKQFATDTDKKLQSAEHRARQAEGNAREVTQKVNLLEERLRQAEQRASQSDARAKSAEDRARKAEAKALDAERQVDSQKASA